ncbi:hypothetical protein ACTFIW_012083 [Dictyostelium discoideum]
MDSKLNITVAHRAKADGHTERMNREIIRILTKASTKYVENKSDIIPLIEFAMNSPMSNIKKISFLLSNLSSPISIFINHDKVFEKTCDDCISLRHYQIYSIQHQSSSILINHYYLFS